MAMDGITLYMTTKQMESSLLNNRIDKIYQPSPNELVFKVSKSLLLLSAHPTLFRMQITKGSYENPASPPMFCMLLRKHLAGGKISKINQSSLERIITLEIQNLDELYEPTTYNLQIELMGKHSNIILTNQSGIVIDSMKRVPASISSVRQILPGITYTLPPSTNKACPLTFLESDFLDLLNNNMTLPFKQVLLDNLLGLSPLMAEEIIAKCNEPITVSTGAIQDFKKTASTIHSFFCDVKSGNSCPTIILKDGFPKYFLPFKSNIITQENQKHYEDFSTMLDSYYSQKDEVSRFSSQKQEIQKHISTLISRCQRKIISYNQDLLDTASTEKYKKYGELITAYSYAIKPGESFATVIDYYDPAGNEITIPLDPQKSTATNAQNYFKKYNKLKRGKEEAIIQIELMENQLAFLENVLVFLSQCSSSQEIEEIRQELINSGFLKKHKTKKTIKPKKPQKYTSDSGIEIYIGKNNTQNDLLTFKLASKGDTWLHTKDIHGSHVIIKANGEEDDLTLLMAAKLCAWFSKARSSSNVPVDYTAVKYVKKPAGALPGKVIYTHQQTIYVTPIQDEILAMK